MNQPAWTPPQAPEPDIGRLNSAVRDIPSYVPTPVPPSDGMERSGRSTLPDRWMHLPTARPLLTYILLAIIAVIYIPMMISPQLNELFLQYGALVKIRVIEGEWWRLITQAFLHGPLLHIALNGYALYMIGMEVEGFFGRARFAAIYAISALAGSVASFIFIPYFTSSVGASGAIFGLVGALAVYFGLNRTLFGKMGQAQFWNILLVILLNVGLGFSGIFPIDNSAHIGGLVAGAVTGFVLCPRYRLGPWRNPLVREVENTNTSSLSWLAIALIALDVIAIFVAALLYFRR
jgi:membrane associated rhomboid family serine protease